MNMLVSRPNLGRRETQLQMGWVVLVATIYTFPTDLTQFNRTLKR